jgi:hypothetical protein
MGTNCGTVAHPLFLKKNTKLYQKWILGFKPFSGSIIALSPFCFNGIIFWGFVFSIKV